MLFSLVKSQFNKNQALLLLPQYCWLKRDKKCLAFIYATLAKLSQGNLLKLKPYSK